MHMCFNFLLSSICADIMSNKGYYYLPVSAISGASVGIDKVLGETVDEEADNDDGERREANIDT